MEPRPGSARDCDSATTLVHGAQRDTVVDEPIPRQCLTTMNLHMLLLLLRTPQPPPHKPGSPLQKFVHQSCAKTELLHGSLGGTKSALHPEMDKAISLALQCIFLSNPHTGRH